MTIPLNVTVRERRHEMQLYGSVVVISVFVVFLYIGWLVVFTRIVFTAVFKLLVRKCKTL